MRFDDSLETVLGTRITSSAGVQSTWRQIVDLVGRRRSSASPAAIARLRSIRAEVPAPVRAASARGLEFANPPAALVAVFVEDELAIAAPVVRSARLTTDEWIVLLPKMAPAARSLLRNRRDLSPRVARALESFGPTDFILPGALVETLAATLPAPVVPEVEPAAEAIPFPVETSFVSLAAAARELPIVAEAMRLAEEKAQTPPAPVVATPGAGTFRIAEIVERIEQHRRERQDKPRADPVAATRFRFETDAQGTIRWVDGVERSAVIGLSLDVRDVRDARVDGVAAGAFRRRAAFGDARLEIGGAADAAGAWRISGVPAFDETSGRFTGYRGTARRPRGDEQAEPLRQATPATDALRQLVHELRTPTNAIVGFAEMIESELLGPVAPAYRDQARAIRTQTRDLIGAIDDLDFAARIESRGLDLRPDRVEIGGVVADALADLEPLARLRGATLSSNGPEAMVEGDARAVERLVSRLLAAVTAAAAPGEQIEVRTGSGGGAVVVEIDRPKALADYPGNALFRAEDDAEAQDGEGGLLLGSGFAFRLARNLVAELGGSMIVGDRQLTLRLPAAVDRSVEQATI